MENKTLGNYGWVVVVVIILSMMIALASPFAIAIKNATVGTINNFGGHLNEALDVIENGDSGSGGSGGANLPAGGEVNAETGEILDSWEVIINNVNNGTYATKYAVGNYKSIDLGEQGVVNMQIAAFDADELAGETNDKAHITWIAKELLTKNHKMNEEFTNAGGWAESDMRNYLHTEVWALIPADVQNSIVEVKKTYYDYTTKSTLISQDKVWIPSYREIFGGTTVEDDRGVVYSELFTDANSRNKKLNGFAAYWWLRSAKTDRNNNFYSVYSGGNASGAADYAGGVALSFCF